MATTAATVTDDNPQRRRVINDRTLIFAVWLAWLIMVWSSNQPRGLGQGDVAILISRGLLGVIITFVLLPRYFHTRRYLVFWLWVASFFVLSGILEETTLEVIFFPTTRGADPLSVTGVMFSFFESMPMIGLMALLKLTWDHNESHKQQEALSRSRVEHELRYLRSQINPHVLFNALNNIYSHALEGSERTPDLLVKLADLLRFMLYECRGDRVPLDREIEHLQDYVALQEMAIEGRGRVTFEVSGDGPGSVQIAPFILIPFVENCFKHSLDTLVSGIVIDIRFQLDGTRLDFTAVNRCGEPVATRRDGPPAGGVGVANVRRRLDLLYPDQHTLTINRRDDTHSVELVLGLEPIADAGAGEGA